MISSERSNKTILRNICGPTVSIAFAMVAVNAAGEPMIYEVQPSHTYPSFEADHWGGLSTWRGKINSTSGTITLDKEAETGTVDISMDMASIDFGHDGMNEAAMTEILFVDRFPTATYTGELVDFQDGKPTAVEGTLTLVGLSQLVNLDINRFRCQPHYMTEREVCGADAIATFDRSKFGVDIGIEEGFFPEVLLRISIEAYLSD